MLFFAVVLLFVGFSNALVLDCNYVTAEWPGIGSTYFCDAKVVRLNGDRVVTGVSQNHASGKTNDDVKGIRFISQQLDFVPQNITGFFKNIQGLRTWSTGVKAISKFDLQQFPDLRHLYINDNAIEVLDGDLFVFTPKVVYIDFGHNKITNVGPNLISHLNGVVVNLFGNVCMSQSAFNATEIVSLSRSLAHLCPPSADMIERIILEGEKFVEVTENVKEVIGAVEENQGKTQRLELRVAQLERIVMQIDALSKVQLDIAEAKLVANEKKFEEKLAEFSANQAKFEAQLANCIRA
jgi:Leucine rich repeat